MGEWRRRGGGWVGAVEVAANGVAVGVRAIEVYSRPPRGRHRAMVGSAVNPVQAGRPETAAGTKERRYEQPLIPIGVGRLAPAPVG